MGLLPIMLHRTPRVGGALTMGFLVSKLVLRCVQIGPRPIRLLEKIGVFVLDRKNAKLGLAYFAVRMAVSKQRTSGRVEKALGYTGLSDEELGEQGIPPQEVAVVLRMLEELDDMRSYAGYKFVEFLLGKRAVDSTVSGRYSLPKGRFNLQQCLGEYFSSPRMQDFHDVIAKGSREGGPGLDKEAVAHQGDRVWGEIQVRMRDDLIDFLVL